MEIPAKLADGVYMLQVPFPPGWFPPEAPVGTLCYLVQQEGGWLMVDSGLNDQTCFNALCQQLTSLSISVEEIRWLLITHFHPDHYGLAGRIKAVSDAAVIMHRQDWDMVQFVTDVAEEWSADSFVEWARSLGVPASEMEGYQKVIGFGRGLFPTGAEPDILLEGDEAPLGESGHLRAILTPGHSPGHVCVYDEERKFLFAGDHVLAGITSHITPSILSGEDQLGKYLIALEKVRRLDVEMVLPAHEEPFNHLSQRVDELLEHHEKRLEQVLAAVQRHSSSLWEIASQVEWTVGLWEQMNGIDRLLAIQETLAHLHLLRDRGRVTATEENGVSIYGVRSEGAGFRN
jgi:glyoxylase-like metal-dependent hydrolase (beta-lactamase superfamily II)